MSNINDRERVTQNIVVKLFKDNLDYTYLGDWQDRPNNKNIEIALLTKWLTNRGTSQTFISKAIRELGKAHLL